MDAILLILRPQPGADATAARARQMGLEALVAPLFTIRPLSWKAPAPGEVGAVILTSGNAVRQGSTQLALFHGLPCYCVGEATAAAAEAAGFGDIRVGTSDGATLVQQAVRDGVHSILHLCGREHIPLDHPNLQVVRRIVYAAEAADALPAQASAALVRGALALLHSPRAGALFAQLVSHADLPKAGIRIAAISDAAAAAAGSGWSQVVSAATPRDEALLELAAKLCQNGPGETGNGR